MGFCKGDGVLDGGVAWFDADGGVDFVGDGFRVEGLEGLMHGWETGHVFVGDDEDSVGEGEVFEIHADFFGAAGAEADARGGHFEGIFFLGGRGRVGQGCGEGAAGLVEEGGGGILKGGIAMTGTIGWMGVLYGAEQVGCFDGSCGCYPNAERHDSSKI